MSARIKIAGFDIPCGIMDGAPFDRVQESVLEVGMTVKRVL